MHLCIIYIYKIQYGMETTTKVPAHVIYRGFEDDGSTIQCLMLYKVAPLDDAQQSFSFKHPNEFLLITGIAGEGSWNARLPLQNGSPTIRCWRPFPLLASYTN